MRHAGLGAPAQGSPFLGGSGCVVNDPEIFPARETPPAFQTPMAMSPLTSKEKVKMMWLDGAGRHWQLGCWVVLGQRGGKGRFVSLGRGSTRRKHVQGGGGS